MSKLPVNILVLEDKQNDAELIRIELEKADFEFNFQHVSDEPSFLNAIAVNRPDVILSDFNIPGYDIYAAKNALKSRNIDSPFILVTGAIGDGRAVELIVNHVIDDYILKDNLARLNTSIERELETYHTQKNLEKSRVELQKLSLVASHTHNGVIISDKDGRIEWVNEAYEKITGYSFEESVGEVPGSLLQGIGTKNKTIDKIRRKLDEEVSFTEEILNYTKNGFPYWIKLDITPVYNESGQLTNFIAIQEDITERKNAEKKLLDSFKQLKRSQEIGKIGSWTFDVLTGETVWSEEMYRLYEWDPDLGPPSASQILNMTSPEMYEMATKTVKSAILKGRPYDITVTLLTEDPKYLRVIGIPVFDDLGDVIQLEGIVQDVTDIQLTKKSLINAKQQIEDIANSIDGVLMQYTLYSDHSDAIQYISKGSKKIFGLSQDEALNNSSIVWDGIHPDDVKSFREAIRHSAKNLSPFNSKWRQYHPDGTMLYLLGRGLPSRKSDNSVIWNTVVFDITEQVMAEKSEDELRELLKTTINEMHIFDAESLKFIYCNKSTVLNTLYDYEELMVMKPRDLKNKLSEKEYRELLRKADEQDGLHFETTQRRKDGTSYNVLVHLKPGTYMGRNVYVANVQDITDKIEAEESYRKIYHTLRSLIDTAPIGIYLINTEGHVIDFWNKAAEKIFGYSRDEAIGNLIPSIEEENFSEVDLLMSEIKEGKSINGRRLQRLKKNGEEIFIELHTTPVFSEDNVDKILVLVKDITGLVQHEQELKVALKDKDILLQEVHHRIKNNLAIIIGFLDMQINGLDENRRERLPLERAMNRIYSIAEVHKLLYARSNLLEVDLSTYLNNLIKHITGSLSSDKEIQFHIDIDKISMNVNELTPLGLLLNELLTNSMKYAFINQNSGEVVIEISKSDSEYKVFYHDNGPGIDESAFESADSAGLSIVKLLLTQLEADYHLDKKNGFTLSFTFHERHRGAYGNMSMHT